MTQVSERTISTSAALIGEGRQMLKEGGGDGSPQRVGQRSEQSGTAHQPHMSTPGLVRRKGEGEGGVQMASFSTPAPVPRFPKDE